MNWLVVPILAVFVVYYQTTVRRIGLLTADSLFVYFQLVLVLGSIPLLDPEIPSDVLYGRVLTYAVCTYMATSMLVRLLVVRSRNELPRGRRLSISVYTPTARLWTVLAVSLIVSLAYYYVVGYSAFFLGLKATLTGQSVDVATLRLNSYSGSRYLAPGYVNQFKNALLPALVVVIVTYFSRTRYRHRLVTAALVSLALLAILGTGQRGAFLLFVVTLSVYLYYLNAQAFPRRFGLTLLFAIVVSSVSSLALGRSSADLASSGGPVTKVGIILDSLWTRVTDNNQYSGIAGFRYTYTLPTRDGAQWLSSLRDLLPGGNRVQGGSLANQIFAYLYDSNRGTSPPSIWGSAYYNFGLAGVIILPVLLAIIFQVLSIRTLRRGNFNTLELIGIAGVFATLGSWVADGPNYLANNGLLMYALIWAFGRRVQADSREPKGSYDTARAAERSAQPSGTRKVAG